MHESSRMGESEVNVINYYNEIVVIQHIVERLGNNDWEPGAFRWLLEEVKRDPSKGEEALLRAKEILAKKNDYK